MTVSDEIVDTSNKICNSAAQLIVSETIVPQISLCYFNRHVKELMA